jgi:hypothetical protein
VYLNVKPKRQIPPKTVLFFSAVFIVLAVFLTGTVMLLTKGRDIKDSLIKLPFTAEDIYLAVGNTVVYTSGNEITCTDTSLGDKWKIQLESNVLNYTSGNSLVAAAGEDVLMVFNVQGQNLFSTRIDGTINSVRLGKDKIAVETDQVLDDRTVSYIVVFGLDGSDIFKLDISGKYVLDYGFDADGMQLYILELDVSDATPISRVATYRPDTQSMTGIKELKDQLVESVYFGESSVFTMGTKQLTEYSSLNFEGKEILVYGWLLEDICDKTDPEFVYVPNSDSDFFDITRIIKPSGDEVKINLPPNVFKILDMGEKIYCFATNNIFVYTGEGKYLRKYDVPFAIDGANRAMSGYVFLKAGEEVYLLPLP